MEQDTTGLTPQGMEVLHFCPHCGRELSRWEHVLLSVDRAILCKGCWYRIVLDVFPDTEKKPGPPPDISSE